MLFVTVTSECKSLELKLKTSTWYIFRSKILNSPYFYHYWNKVSLVWSIEMAFIQHFSSIDIKIISQWISFPSVPQDNLHLQDLKPSPKECLPQVDPNRCHNNSSHPSLSLNRRQLPPSHQSSHPHHSMTTPSLRSPTTLTTPTLSNQRTSFCQQ